MDLSGDAEAAATIDMRSAVLLAVACGLAVADVYYAQPLVEQIGADLGIGRGALGLITATTQGGYLLGLVLIVPLGDLVERRRLIVALMVIAACALIAVVAAPGMVWLFAANALVGSASVVVQVIVAYAAASSAPQRRGRVVGTVTSGVVIGILLARLVSGWVAELAGWRAMYAVAAVTMLGMAGVLAGVLPRDRIARPRVPYLRLITTTLVMGIREPVVRVRAAIGLLMFTAFGAVWGAMALPLTAAPWHLSTGEIGMFALVGAAGALGATGAGRLADRGHARTVTAIALVMLTLSWAAIAAAPWSLPLLALGVVALDLAIQALHVTNQQLIVAVDPTASSRLIAGYMIFYSLGSGTGAAVATTLYSVTGWSGVCVFGAAISALALGVRFFDRPVTGSPDAHPIPANATCE
ncbi:MFS transporter [Nocardia aurantia]|uniref:Putative transporter n=1 Tax=Nocardia aurantia TaxID=2585199 RepID=A0A7K0E1R7_9NOCA|nr:MFS transporter [Nocardia aurantia]MQY31748.1 putative transporter [Nocardia aurantia]